MNAFHASDPGHFATRAVKPSDLATCGPPDLKVIEINTTGTLYTVHLALAYFRAQEPVDGWRGKIVVTGSNASIYPFPNDTLYGVSKASQLGLVRALGPKVLPEQITVNALGPSCVRTTLAPQDFFDMLEREGRLTPMETVIRAIDIFTDAQSRLTGQIAELCMDKVVLRNPAEFLDNVVEKNLEPFHPLGEIKAALDPGSHETL